MVERLRVLWITSTQFPAVTGAASMKGGGWMEGWRWSLAHHHPEVDLGILSYGSVQHPPLALDDATYFCFPRRDEPGKARELARRWSHRDQTGLGRHATFADVVHSFEPDLIHVHGSETGLARMTFHSPKPVLISLQGLATLCQRFMFAGLSPGHLAAEFLKPRFYKGYGHLHSYLLMRDRAKTEQHILSQSRFLLGNTQWDRAVAAVLAPAALYYHADRAVRREFYDGTWSASKDKFLNPVVYCTGGAAPYKGLEFLLEAVALLRRTDFPGLRLRIAGPIDRAYHWPTLQRLSARADLRGAVSWLGELDARQVVHELESATLFLQPSHIENESNTLIEAMLVGTPCVASHVGGIPSMLTEGRSGLLVHDRDPYALAGAMRELLRNPEWAASLARSGRETARQRHDPKSVSDQLVEVYRDVLRRTTQAQRLSADGSLERAAQ
ncbi:MAG: glycosyltransferase [Thermoleophilia bacterium]